MHKTTKPKKLVLLSLGVIFLLIAAIFSVFSVQTTRCIKDALGSGQSNELARSFLKQFSIATVEDTSTFTRSAAFHSLMLKDAIAKKDFQTALYHYEKSDLNVSENSSFQKNPLQLTYKIPSTLVEIHGVIFFLALIILVWKILPGSFTEKLLNPLPRKKLEKSKEALKSANVDLAQPNSKIKCFVEAGNELSSIKPNSPGSLVDSGKMIEAIGASEGLENDKISRLDAKSTLPETELLQMETDDSEVSVIPEIFSSEQDDENEDLPGQNTDNEDSAPPYPDVFQNRLKGIVLEESITNHEPQEAEKTHEGPLPEEIKVNQSEDAPEEDKANKKAVLNCPLSEIDNFPLADYPSKRINKLAHSEKKVAELLFELKDNEKGCFSEPSMVPECEIESSPISIKHLQIIDTTIEPEESGVVQHNPIADTQLASITMESPSTPENAPTAISLIHKPSQITQNENFSQNKRMAFVTEESTTSDPESGSLNFLNEQPFQIPELEFERALTQPEVNENLRNFSNLIQRHLSKQNTKVIGVTSSSDMNNRACFSFLLGKTFSEVDCKTLIIDADFDRPRINLFTDEPCIYGLKHLLDPANADQDIFIKSEFERLSLFPSGTPGEEHQSRMNEDFWNLVLKVARLKFEVIIVVLPNLKGLEKLQLHQEKLLMLTMLNEGKEKSINEFFYSKVMLKKYNMKLFKPIKTTDFEE